MDNLIELTQFTYFSICVHVHELEHNTETDIKERSGSNLLINSVAIESFFYEFELFASNFFTSFAISP